jgi:hypothetical protein
MIRCEIISNVFDLYNIKSNETRKCSKVGPYLVISRPCIEPKVYNFVSSAQKPIHWYEYVRYCEQHGLRHPSQQAIWYYMLVMTPHKRRFQLLSLMLHELPARTLDLISAALGRPQK